MTPNPWTPSGARKARIVLLLAAAHLVAQDAAARVETIRWSYPEPALAAGFEALVGTSPGSSDTVVDLGKPTADALGVFRGTIEVADDATVYVTLRAYASDGERSASSNEKVYAPPAAPPPPPEDDDDDTGGGDTGGGGSGGGDTGGGDTGGGDSGGGDTGGGDTGGGDAGGGGSGGDDTGGGATSDPIPDLAEVDGALLFESFETLATGSYVPDWLDTDQKNSLAEKDSLFTVADLEGNRVLRTTNTQTNIHSHHTGEGSESWEAYELRGRLRVGNASGGIGVTLYSAYPDADVYYRLRRFSGNAFHLSMHGSVDCPDGWTEVTPQANTWYLYRIQVVPEDVQNVVRARVWAQGTSEPADWQAWCNDPTPTRRTGGRVGAWAMGPGNKYWDDFQVIPLEVLEGPGGEDEPVLLPPQPPVLLP